MEIPLSVLLQNMMKFQIFHKFWLFCARQSFKNKILKHKSKRKIIPKFRLFHYSRGVHLKNGFFKILPYIKPLMFLAVLSASSNFCLNLVGILNNGSFLSSSKNTPRTTWHFSYSTHLYPSTSCKIPNIPDIPKIPTIPAELFRNEKIPKFHIFQLFHSALPFNFS